MFLIKVANDICQILFLYPLRSDMRLPMFVVRESNQLSFSVNPLLD